MITLLIVVIAMIVGGGGLLAVNDFKLPALPQRKRKALGSSIKNLKSPAELMLDDEYYFWTRKALDNAWINARSGSPKEARLKDARYSVGYGHEENRDYKLMNRLRTLHKQQNGNAVAIGGIEVVTKHLVEAYRLNLKSMPGDDVAKEGYKEILDVLEAEIKALEDGYKAAFALEQQTMLKHYTATLAALTPKPESEHLNLDSLSQRRPAGAIEMTKPSPPKSRGAVSPKSPVLNPSISKLTLDSATCHTIYRSAKETHVRCYSNKCSCKIKVEESKACHSTVVISGTPFSFSSDTCVHTFRAYDQHGVQYKVTRKYIDKWS